MRFSVSKQRAPRRTEIAPGGREKTSSGGLMRPSGRGKFQNELDARTQPVEQDAVVVLLERG